jgi:UDP-N-acetylmuramoyl-tripeptide--D-alanyl-D-alanine ligase
MSVHAELLAFFERHIKPVAKAGYRGPIIELARLWRALLPQLTAIGITGSAGKTTTKELLHAALATRYRCVKSSDSDNQLYDIARTLLRCMPWSQYCVQEVGASTPGRFDPMVALLRPQVAVVTNVGTDHMSAFRSREAVAAEKAKLVHCLPADGLAVLNADDALVMDMATQCRARVVTYGFEQAADFRAELLSHRWPDRLTLKVHHQERSVQVNTALLTAYQAVNVLAAVATACALGVSLEDAARSVGTHVPVLARMSVQSTARGVTVIRDDLKAPEWSLTKAMDYIGEAHATRKIIVLGTISDSSGRRHLYRRAVTAALAAADQVLLVGTRAAASGPGLQALGGERLHVFPNVREAWRWLDGYLQSGDLMLLKGSKSADHLARLGLALDRQVGCWRVNCERDILCDRCSLLSIPSES